MSKNPTEERKSIISILPEKSSVSVAPASTVGGGRGADAEDEPMDTQDNEVPAAVKQAASTSSKPPVDQSTARKPEEPKPSPTEETSATALAGKDSIGLSHFIANMSILGFYQSPLSQFLTLKCYF